MRNNEAIINESRLAVVRARTPEGGRERDISANLSRKIIALHDRYVSHVCDTTVQRAVFSVVLALAFALLIGYFIRAFL